MNGWLDEVDTSLGTLLILPRWQSKCRTLRAALMANMHSLMHASLSLSYTLQAIPLAAQYARPSSRTIQNNLSPSISRLRATPCSEDVVQLREHRVLPLAAAPATFNTSPTNSAPFRHWKIESFLHRTVIVEDVAAKIRCNELASFNLNF